MKHSKMMAKLQRTPSWFKEEPEVRCNICGKPIEEPDRAEHYCGEPVHGFCKEVYIQSDEGPDYEPE